MYRVNGNGQKKPSMLLLERERGRVAKNRKYKPRYGTIGKNAIEAEVTKEVEELDMNSATYGRADKWASHGDVTTGLNLVPACTSLWEFSRNSLLFSVFCL